MLNKVKACLLSDALAVTLGLREKIVYFNPCRTHYGFANGADCYSDILDKKLYCPPRHTI
jgi:hypothetical protein